MNDAAKSVAEIYWHESKATSEARAMGHAWTEFKRQDDGSVVIAVNRVEAVRLSIKYRENGPYLCVEMFRGGTSETMGACLVAAEMASRYADILDAHNELGNRLHSARSFLISTEERERARAAQAQDEHAND